MGALFIHNTMHRMGMLDLYCFGVSRIVWVEWVWWGGILIICSIICFHFLAFYNCFVEALSVFHYCLFIDFCLGALSLSWRDFSFSMYTFIITIQPPLSDGFMMMFLLPICTPG